MRFNGAVSGLLMAWMLVAMVQAHFVIDGWFNCSARESTSGSSDLPRIPQCALIQVPLCHNDVCTSNKTINLFVKRILSSSPRTSPDVWFIQGGPGESSDRMESGMQDLMTVTNGSINVYSVDHRGTGRSNRLDCVTAKATTSPRPGRKRRAKAPQGFAACSADLTAQFGNDLSAFSITSAAKDLAMLVNELKSDGGVFVYGLSYGTAVVERLMHFNVTGVAGYVLDGVATSSGSAPADKFEYFSSWDLDFGQIGDWFLEVCKNDTFCSGKFGSKGPAQTLHELYARMDSNETTNACFQMVGNRTKSPLSHSLRKTLGALLMGSFRAYIPVLVYRLARCAPHDQEVIEYFLNATSKHLSIQKSDTKGSHSSMLLYRLITFSEMWELPPPSQSEMMKRFTNQLISNREATKDVVWNCLFRMDRVSRACQEAKINWQSLPNDTKPIAYPRDKYWNVSARIPHDASVLILNGKMDPQTNYRYAEYLYEAIDANPEQKKLLLFEYLAHGVVFLGDDFNETPCGMKIMASYVTHAGNLSAIDTDCMNHQAPIRFNLNASQSMAMGTTDAYEGKLTDDARRGKHLTRHSKFKLYRTLLVVFAVLFTISIAVVAILLCTLRKARQRDESAKYTQVTDV